MKLRFLLDASLIAGLLTAIAAPSAIAGSFSTVRRITANNIYQCNTGLAWERETGASNVYFTTATFAMGCLNPDGTARWILQSESGCNEETPCPENLMDYLSPDYDDETGTYTRNLTDIEIGIDCRNQPYEQGGSLWICKEVALYDALTVETVGLAEMMSVGMFESRGGQLPEPDIVQGLSPDDEI